MNILVVVAHPGDEILGMGGTLRKHVILGDKVRILVLGDGWTSRASTYKKGREIIDLDYLEAQGREALKILGIESVTYCRLPDNRLDTQPMLELVKLVECEKTTCAPDRVYTNSIYDLNVDQRRTCHAVVTAFRPQENNSETSLYSFETLSSTEWCFTGEQPGFSPNVFFSINEQLDLKLKAYSQLETEQRDWPHARSLKAISHHAATRGVQVGLESAEAFMLLRQVIQ